MELLEWFNKGLITDEYVAGMKVNKDEMNKIYSEYSLNQEEKEQIQAIKSKELKAIVISEDWCGDAMLNNPILLKLAEEAGIDVRFILRDQNLELMDQYLTNGTARSIPIFIFIDQNGEEKAVWGPRAEKLQELVTSERSKLPDQESPDFKDKQMEMYKHLRERYQQEEELWHTVAKSILAVL
ncbi:thioredoxin family protein [Niallia endozanthoxylica]|uniref:Thioredoxin family protein n=1 Tax=Niallia endozanthoxylica TaxID=2036016 RepID=A0A5J5HMK6_9BACI|nr:thioredoxin family protein [Niallia endozanthoxylica]KAA9022503.1 thioredoxin family protein [Niallia endozanthoxylica]